MRVPILVIVYLLPTFLDIVGVPMDAAFAKPLREVAQGGLVIVTAVWISTQGRRRPDEGGEN